MSRLEPLFTSPLRRAGFMLVWFCISLLAASSGCATGVRVEAAAEPVRTVPVVESGFLTSYAPLRPSEQSPSVLFWRDTTAKKGFRKVLLRPVEVWRGADRRLDDIPESDLQYLADSLYRALSLQLGRSFELVEKTGANVLEIQLALTLVTRPNQRIDYFSTDVPVRNLPERSAAMDPATAAFVRDCAVEAEFAVAEPLPRPLQNQAADRRRRSKRIVKAAMFDKRRGDETSKGNVRTWNDVDEVFVRWSEVLDSQLVALKDGTFKPKLTVRN